MTVKNGIIVYWNRWVLLFVECCAIFARNYVSRSFAVANKITANYFRVDSSAVDILTVGDNVLASPMCIIIAFFGSTLGLRKLMLIQLLFLCVGSTLTTVGFLTRDLYWIVACGRILMGPPEAIIYILPTILAAHWFPNRELATAYGLVWFSHCLGGVVSGIVLPYLFENQLNPIHKNNATNDTPSTTGNMTTLDGLSLYTHDYENERFKFMLSYGATALMLFTSLVLAVIFCKDHPPTPPSAAQEEIVARSQANSDKMNTVLRKRMKQVASLLTNREFILLTVIAVLKSSSMMVLVLLPSFIMKSFNVGMTVPGWLLVINYLVAGIGALLAGKIIDVLKTYKTILIISQVGMVVCCISIFLGHSFHNLLALFFVYPLGGLFYFTAFTALLEILMETTYPLDKIVTTSIFYSFYTIFGFLFVEFDRWIEKIKDEKWAIFVLTPVNILVLGLILITKPEYKRSAVEKGTEENKRLIP